MSSDPPPLLTNHWAKEAGANTVERPACHCLDPQYRKTKWSELQLHSEQQDITCSGWTRLLELIEEAVIDRREEFSPGRELTPQQWTEIVTLPASIAKLKSVKKFVLYGSSLVRIPPEIGEMTSLEEFVPYTSYRLHWFPYEITRCENLKQSTVSTRALFGNFKYRPPFPKLPQLRDTLMPASCSVCNSPLGTSEPLQYWITLGVATDVLPLLAHVCSTDCLTKLPSPPKEYVQKPHQGGLNLNQPPRR